jgi:hypothetical protein
MRSNKKYPAVAFLVATMALAHRTDAMPIRQFDKMSVSDQAKYMGVLLDGTASQFKAEGKQIDLINLMNAFRHSSRQGLAPGFTEFKSNLDAAREANKANANNPGEKPLDVEHAFALTLKQNGIPVSSKELLAAGRGFKPSASSPGSGLNKPQSNTNPNP